MKNRFTITVLPVPQGSKRAFVIKGKDGRHRPVLAESAKELKPWRAQIALAARQAMIREQCVSWHKQEPLYVRLEFVLPRPKSLPKRVVYPAKRPDLSKLVRAVEDALTGIVWADDAQVTAIAAFKDYSAFEPGVRVEITERGAS